jgi:MFS-type transporter involved in bile tolerance (Atg22 family)
MEFVHLLLRYLHLLGFAAVFGGWLVSLLSRKFNFNSAMLYGIATQLATGIVLYGLASADGDANHAKLGVKFLLALLLGVMIAIPVWKKRATVAAGHFYATGALIAVTAGVAVFWT